MKIPIVVSLILLGVLSGRANAACTGTPLTTTQLTSLLTGNMVCASHGGDRWQEEHRVGGQLWDYKKGPGDPIDPEEQVGTWTITGATGHAAGLVNYMYSGGSTYSYTVFNNGNGTYSFCGPSAEITATIKPGPGWGSCP